MGKQCTMITFLHRGRVRATKELVEGGAEVKPRAIGRTRFNTLGIERVNQRVQRGRVTAKHDGTQGQQAHTALAITIQRHALLFTPFLIATQIRERLRGIWVIDRGVRIMDRLLIRQAIFIAGHIAVNQETEHAVDIFSRGM